MIKSFEICGYKKFKQIKFDNLSKINIFLGDNNAGKTTVLESVFAAACGSNINPIIESSILRRSHALGTYDYVEKFLGAFNNNNKTPFEFSFNIVDGNGKKTTIQHKFNPSNIFSNIKPNLTGIFASGGTNNNNSINNIQINQNGVLNNIPQNYIGEWNVLYNNKPKKKMPLYFPNVNNLSVGNTLFSAKYTDILAHRNQQENTMIYSCLKREQILDEFIEELSNTFGNVEDIDSVPYPDGSSSPVSIKIKGSKYIPLYNFGDGFQRWFNILGSMVYMKNSIHCIEEIDVTFHMSAQKELTKNLIKYASKYNNQLFITSHSIEFIDNFLESADKKDLSNIRIITLKNDEDPNITKHRVLDGNEALKSREEYRLELRL